MNTTDIVLERTRRYLERTWPKLFPPNSPPDPTPAPRPEPLPLPKSKLWLNAAQCMQCKDVAISRHRHDFQFCRCGAIAVDGGPEYLRRAGNIGDMADMSASMPVDSLDSQINYVEQVSTELFALLAKMQTRRDMGLGAL